MKLIHWSKYPVKVLRSSEQIKGYHWDSGWWGPKPTGLWVSDESRGAHGWLKWCTAENFRLDTLKYEYRVKLKPDARILYITSSVELDEFTNEYKAPGPMDEDSVFIKRMKKYRSTYEPPIMGIDWSRVAEKYQGIVISPYIWSMRLETRYTWYYGWDCASGVIWDKDAIKSFELVKQHVVPRKKRKINWAVQSRKMEKLVARMDKVAYGTRTEKTDA